MSGASRALDPIAAAEAGIAGSKDLIASVADDLSQHQRWLAHYRVAEKRHARRVMLQELMYQLETGRRGLMRLSKRFGLISLRLARSLAAFLSRTSAALLVVLRRVITACAIWIRPRAYALALILRRWLAAFWAWALVTSGILARAGIKAASIALAWTGVQSRALATTLRQRLAAAGVWTLLNTEALARASSNAASIGFACIAAKSRALVLALQRGLSAGAAWTGAKSGALARASLATASAGLSWADLNVRRISHAYSRVGGQADTGHRALVVRRCTALACIEPRRAGLPAMRAA